VVIQMLLRSGRGRNNISGISKKSWPISTLSERR